MLEGPEGEGETTLGPHVSPLHVLRDNKREEQQVQICSAQHSEEENPCQLCNSTGQPIRRRQRRRLVQEGTK